MTLSARDRYACLVMIAIARHQQDGPPISAPEISRYYNLSKDLVSQVLLRLKRAGLVQSQRGMHGGYRLSKPAEDISLRSILGSIGTTAGSAGDEEPAPEPALVSVIKQIRDAERTILRQTTLAQLVAAATPPDWVI